MTKRINLWSGPRNVSTALMYSFAQRPDCHVFDEPLYAHYLLHTGKSHPGRNEIINSMERDGDLVVRNLLLGNNSSPLLFFKQMTHHLEGLNFEFLLEMDNIILIRDPREILFSYSKVIPDVKMEDIGIQKAHWLYNHLVQLGKKPLVLDSRFLLEDPESVLKQLCLLLKIPWTGKMLSWVAGPKKEDGVWAKYWYENTHQSTGYIKYTSRKVILNDKLEKLALECKPYFTFLSSKAIKAKSR